MLGQIVFYTPHDHRGVRRGHAGGWVHPPASVTAVKAKDVRTLTVFPPRPAHLGAPGGPGRRPAAAGHLECGYGMTRPVSTRSLGRRRRTRPVDTAAGPVRPVVEDADGPVTFANPGHPTSEERRRYAAALASRLPAHTREGLAAVDERGRARHYGW